MNFNWTWFPSGFRATQLWTLISSWYHPHYVPGFYHTLTCLFLLFSLDNSTVSSDISSFDIVFDAAIQVWIHWSARCLPDWKWTLYDKSMQKKIQFWKVHILFQDTASSFNKAVLSKLYLLTCSVAKLQSVKWQTHNTSSLSYCLPVTEILNFNCSWRFVQ